MLYPVECIFPMVSCIERIGFHCLPAVFYITLQDDFHPVREILSQIKIRFNIYGETSAAGLRVFVRDVCYAALHCIIRIIIPDRITVSSICQYLGKHLKRFHHFISTVKRQIIHVILILLFLQENFLRNSFRISEYGILVTRKLIICRIIDNISVTVQFPYAKLRVFIRV